MLPKPLATAIIIVVTIVWAVNFAAQFIVADYSPDVAINGIFMAVVGGALALSRGTRGDDGNGNGNGPTQEEDPEPAKVE